MKKLIATIVFLSIGAATASDLTGPIGGGGGGGGGSGTVTNIATSCGVSGGPITSTGTISASTAVNPETGANYAFQSSDCGKLVNLSNASNQIPTIASGATLGAGWFTEACNQGAGTQTITPASGNIGGASTYVLAAGTAAAPKCVGIVSDGANLQLDMTGVGGGSTPGGSSGQLQTNNGSGGFGAVAAPSGAVVGTTDTQTLTGKSISGNQINSGVVGSAEGGAGAVNGMMKANGSGTTSQAVSGTDYQAPWSSAIQSGNWVLPFIPSAIVQSGAIQALGSMYCHSGGIINPTTIKALGALLTTPIASSHVQFSVYGPGNGTVSLIDSTISTISSASAASINGTMLLTTDTLAPGTYWWCTQGDTSGLVFEAINSVAPGIAMISGSATQANSLSAAANIVGKIFTGQTFGSPPPTLTISSGTDDTARRTALLQYQVN